MPRLNPLDPLKMANKRFKEAAAQGVSLVRPGVEGKEGRVLD